MKGLMQVIDPTFVVPFVGTWIEIPEMRDEAFKRGVVPFVGTWIEIDEEKELFEMMYRRSLRGNVD